MRSISPIFKWGWLGVFVFLLASYVILQAPIFIGHRKLEQQILDSDFEARDFRPTASASHPLHLLD